MNYKVEDLHPYDSDQSKTEQIEVMFDEISPVYDKMNGILSLGIDNYWRKEAINVLKHYPHQHILDVASGTGDFAILAEKILQPKEVIGIDISDGMMDIGKRKVLKAGLQNKISFQHEDCADLSFNDNTFDTVTVAFGVRNFEDIDKCFSEVVRVLKPGGVFLFLELSTPEQSPMKQLYGWYSEKVMPVMSNLFATEQSAYEYLPKSVQVFPQGRQMMLILKKNGFRNIRLRRLTLGICTLYIAET